MLPLLASMPKKASPTGITGPQLTLRKCVISVSISCIVRSFNGGVAQDLPKGWDRMMRDFLQYLPPRLRDYDKALMKNTIFRKRTIGVGA